MSDCSQTALLTFLPTRPDSRALRDSSTSALSLDKLARYEVMGNVESVPHPVLTSLTRLIFGEGAGDRGDLEEKITRFLSATEVHPEDATSQPPITRIQQCMQV